jgi:hypothetical protein
MAFYARAEQFASAQGKIAAIVGWIRSDRPRQLRNTAWAPATKKRNNFWKVLGSEGD